MGKLTFRTIFGGPRMPNVYIEELNSIESRLSQIDFEFDLDLSLTIGGDMVMVTHPTGLRMPRIYPDKSLASGAIFLNNDDIAKQKDHSAFLRQTIFNACTEIFDRMDKKKVTFGKAAEMRKLDFLSE